MPYCPFCGAQDYGTPFCISCQRPIQREVQPSVDGSPVGGQPPAQSLKPSFQPRFAGLWRRSIAFLADWSILGIIAEIVQKVYLIGGGEPATHRSLNASMGISALMFILYFTLLVGDSGQTLAKALLGIRVVRTDGRPVTYGRALLRVLGYFLSSTFLCLGFFWALWDRRKQTWHDKIADTVVVRT